MNAQPFKLQPQATSRRSINSIQSPQVEGDSLQEDDPCQFKAATGLQYHERGITSGWQDWDGHRRGNIGGVVTRAIVEVEIGDRSNPVLKLVIPSVLVIVIHSITMP